MHILFLNESISLSNSKYAFSCHIPNNNELSTVKSELNK